MDRGVPVVSDPVLLAVDARGVATATLNRPERGNAYDEDMLAALIAGLQRLAPDPAVRALVIRGAGKHFQAGADLHWLARAAAYTPDQAYAASMATVRAMQLLNEFPKPTIAAGARRLLRRRLRPGVLRGRGAGHPGRAVRPDGGARRRRAHADLDPHGARHGAAPNAPLRHHRRAVRRGGGAADRPGARGGGRRRAGGAAWRRAGRRVPLGAGRHRGDQALLPRRQRLDPGRARHGAAGARELDPARQRRRAARAWRRSRPGGTRRGTATGVSWRAEHPDRCWCRRRCIQDGVAVLQGAAGPACYRLRARRMAAVAGSTRCWRDAAGGGAVLHAGATGRRVAAAPGVAGGGADRRRVRRGGRAGAERSGGSR